MGNGLRYSERGPIRLADTALPILSDIVPRAPAFAPPEATFLRRRPSGRERVGRFPKAVSGKRGLQAFSGTASSVAVFSLGGEKTSVQRLDFLILSLGLTIAAATVLGGHFPFRGRGRRKNLPGDHGADE